MRKKIILFLFIFLKLIIYFRAWVKKIEKKEETPLFLAKSFLRLCKNNNNNNKRGILRLLAI
jgi:hypothetical protein